MATDSDDDFGDGYNKPADIDRLLRLLNKSGRETLPYSETRILRQLVRMKLKNDWLAFNGQNKEFDNDEIIEKWLP